MFPKKLATDLFALSFSSSSIRLSEQRFLLKELKIILICNSLDFFYAYISNKIMCHYLIHFDTIFKSVALWIINQHSCFLLLVILQSFLNNNFFPSFHLSILIMEGCPRNILLHIECNFFPKFQHKGYLQNSITEVITYNMRPWEEPAPAYSIQHEMQFPAVFLATCDLPLPSFYKSERVTGPK